MIHRNHLRYLVIAPTLEHLGLHSMAAENLLMGTAAQESRLGRYLAQVGGGPALGIYQIEPATHRDVWDNFLAYHADLASKVRGIASQHWFDDDPDGELVRNLAYATAIARLCYYRRPEPLPDADDLPGLARYWKQHYNTAKGAGTPMEFIANYQALVLEKEAT